MVDTEGTLTKRYEMRVLMALSIMVASSWCLAKPQATPKQEYKISIVNSLNQICKIEGVGMYVNSKIKISSAAHDLTVTKMKANSGDQLTVRPWSDFYLLESHDCYYLRVTKLPLGEVQFHNVDGDKSFRVILH